MLDATPPPKFWLPSKPAIIRAHSDTLDHLAQKGMKAVFPLPFFVPPVVSLTEYLIDRTTGTNIGGMTGNGGLSAAFDGVTNQVATSTATSTGGETLNSIGKTLAVPSIISKCIVFGSNNLGYSSNSPRTITLSLYGKVGSAPTSHTDGTLLGTLTPFTSLSNESTGRTITSSDLTTVYNHVLLAIAANSNTFLACAELQLYGLH
jgi:hypothetical protein